MNKFTALIENLKKEMGLTNIKIVQEQAAKSKIPAALQKKIDNYIVKYGDILTKEEVIEAIKTNIFAAIQFAVAPGRQNPVEKWIIDNTDFKKMATTGAEAVSFSPEGGIVYGETGGVNSKTADFCREGDEFIYTQKYTKEKGGAQDNQYNDVCTFLSYGSIYHKVGAIVDGEVWDTEWKEKLKRQFEGNENVVITSMNEILFNNETI
jgi:hypothetical protein